MRGRGMKCSYGCDHSLEDCLCGCDECQDFDSGFNQDDYDSD